MRVRNLHRLGVVLLLIFLVAAFFVVRVDRSGLAEDPQLTHAQKGSGVTSRNTRRVALSLDPISSSLGTRSGHSGASLIQEELPTLLELQGKDEQALRGILREGDICAAEKFAREESPSAGLILEVLADGQSTSLPKEVLFAFVEAFSAPTVRDVLRLLEQEKHPALRFFQALLMADLMVGYPNSTFIDYSAALKELDALTIAYPENGAYFFYRAGVLSLMGESKEKLKEAARKAFGSKKFDDHTPAIFRGLLELGLLDAKRASLAWQLYVKSPVPSMQESFTVFKQFLEAGDVLFADEITSFARVMMDDGLKYRSLPGGIFWAPYGYGAGWKLLELASEVLGRGSEFQGIYPHYKTLFESSHLEIRNKINAAYPGRAFEICHPEKLVKIFDSMKENLNQYHLLSSKKAP